MAKKNNVNKKTVTIELEYPLESGEETIKEVELRKPYSGDLRSLGLQLALLIAQDVDSMVKLIPRISNLSARDVENLEMEDFTAVSMGIVGFFVKLD